MCGRFTLTVEIIKLIPRFEIVSEELIWNPRYNIAPTQLCPVIIEENHRRMMVPMIWGLIPHWSKDKKSGYSMINARAETFSQKPSFRNISKKHCLIPADGFFEWKKTTQGKIPYFISLKNREMFAFAGLWDVWKGDDNEVVRSFTILTTQANALLSPLHDRMPVILKKEQEASWLNPEIEDKSIFNPYPVDNMQMYEVSQTVNSWKNDSPECIHKVLG